MKALIIENEDFAANNLKSNLKNIALEIDIVDVCKTAQEAVLSILKHKPELIFLDIELDGEVNGIEMLTEFKNIDFKIIFTTSYNHFALAAFRINAIDYLVKPYNVVDLARAIEKMNFIKIGEQASKLNILSKKNGNVGNQTNTIGFRNQKGDVEMHKYSDIEYLEADGSQVFIYFVNGTKICNTTASLSDFDIILKSYGFLRIHHKHIINLNEMNLLKKSMKNDHDNLMGAGGQIILHSGKKLPVSRNYLSEIRKFTLI